MREAGSTTLRKAMTDSDAWIACRLAYVEVMRALGRSHLPGGSPARRFHSEWPAFTVVELDQALAEAAARLAVEEGLRSLDAIHLAAAAAVADADSVVATWDARLHTAAHRRGLEVMPARIG
ncbi:MAG: PIN domain-containing protein [Thermoleophilaceae bacterium]|nr:PIN domain-containing protein [Thermoleophilaceae bacterium]